MAFEIQALQELKPNGKYKATELEDGSFVLKWDPEKNGGEAAPTMDEINTKAAQIASEIPIRHLRRIRNELLAETDWMANSDVTMSDEWKAYRQSLRDLPSTTDPDNPVYPTPPS